MIRIAVCDDDTDSILKNDIILKNCLSHLKAVAEIQTYSSGQMLLCDDKSPRDRCFTETAI